MVDRLPPIHPRKAERDTAAGCAERAEADLATAATSDNENIRHRFERSAESWTTRAELLQSTEAMAGRREARPAATAKLDAALPRRTLHPSFGAIKTEE